MHLKRYTKRLIHKARLGEKRLKKHRLNGWIMASILCGVSVVAIVVACMLGAVNVSISDFFSLVIGNGNADAVPNSYNIILFDVRMPRVLLSFVVGGALSVCGACMQGIFKNALAEPYILGVSSGAGFGATLFIAFGGAGLGYLGITGFAFIGGLIAIAMVLWLGYSKTRTRTIALLLSGVAMSTFFSALTSVVMIAERDKMEHIVLWTMGSFSSATWDSFLLVAPIIILGCMVCVFFARDLNVMLLGDEQARQLGVDINKIRWILLVVTALITSAAVSVCGIIGFVGLIIPHTIRMLIGPNHRMLIINSFLGGGVFLTLCDLIARTVVAPVEIPVGVVTAVCGVPFFLLLLKNRTKKGEIM